MSAGITQAPEFSWQLSWVSNIQDGWDGWSSWIALAFLSSLPVGLHGGRQTKQNKQKWKSWGLSAGLIIYTVSVGYILFVKANHKAGFQGEGT